jgi:hypothetical protein
MFVRGVEVIAKPSKTLEVADTIRERALPILRKQSGFVDEIVLVSDTEVDHVLALSFWNTKEDAERYHGDEYPTLYEPTCDGLGAELFKFRPLDKDDALPMVRKACAGEMRWRPGGRPGSESVHSTTLATLAEPNRCQVGPTILFDRPPAGAPAPHLIRSQCWAGHGAEGLRLWRGLMSAISQ